MKLVSFRDKEQVDSVGALVSATELVDLRPLIGQGHSGRARCGGYCTSPGLAGVRCWSPRQPASARPGQRDHCSRRS